MTPQDRARLDGLLAAVARRQAEMATTHEPTASLAPMPTDDHDAAEGGIAPFRGSDPLARVEVALILSSRALGATFTSEELARLRRLRRVFLRQHGITPRDEQNETD